MIRPGLVDNSGIFDSLSMLCSLQGEHVKCIPSLYLERHDQPQNLPLQLLCRLICQKILGGRKQSSVGTRTRSESRATHLRVNGDASHARSDSSGLDIAHYICQS